MSNSDTAERRRAERTRNRERRNGLPDPKKESLLHSDNVILVREYDTIIFATVILLLLFGLVMILSSSYYVSLTREAFHYNIFYFFSKQALATLIGFLAMIIAAVVNYRLVCKLAPALYILACICLVLVLFTDPINGARRWLTLGPISFQPSEFAKVSVVLLLSSYLGKDKNRACTLRGILTSGLIIVIPIALVGIGGNLSTIIILGLIGAGIFFVASPLFWPLIALAAAGVGAIQLILPRLSGFRAGRVAAQQDPFSDPDRFGFQIIQGLYAVASGGLFGLGLGRSNQKLNFIPEPYNDFIFAVICEELGFFGAALVLLLFGIFVWRGTHIALHASDLTGTLIATGATILVAVQVIINVAVVTNTIVNTGIPMPFISYGGTSVAFILALTGVVLNVSRYSKKQVS